MNASKIHDAVTFSMVAAQLLQQECSEKGQSMSEFFQRAGISQPTWSRVMRGQTKLSLEDVRAGCSVLKISMKDLLDEAETVAARLPEQDVQLITPKGTIPKDEDEGPGIGTIILASAALAFVISRLVSR
jgi:transcriptional regulator with XRE-family HTH domain